VLFFRECVVRRGVRAAVGFMRSVERLMAWATGLFVMPVARQGVVSDLMRDVGRLVLAIAAPFAAGLAGGIVVRAAGAADAAGRFGRVALVAMGLCHVPTVTEIPDPLRKVVHRPGK
jgi:putative effector of murein hydrolase